VVELAHLGVQTRSRRSTGMQRPYPSVDQAMIDLVEGVFIWGVLFLEVDLFVHEVRTFHRHLPACGKVEQSMAIFICTLMQAVFAYRWLMYGFAANFCIRVSHHELHVMTWTGCNCPLQRFIKLILRPTLLSHFLVHVC
jgi:hypothetical protein